MGMVVRSNIMAINANRSLGTNNSQVSKSLEKLSSGFKINRAGDDAAGLAISEKMKAQIKGLEQASANSQDGISLVQTAEGALTEVHSMLNRMVELATKSANGTIQDKVDREAIQSEIDALITEVDRIGDSTNFNGINLLDGSMGSGTTGVKASIAGANVHASNKNTVTASVDFSVSGLEAGKNITINLVADATGSDGISVDAAGNVTVNIKGTADRVFTQTDMDNLIRNATLPKSAKNLKIEMSGDMTVSSTAADATTALVNSAVGEAKKASVDENGVTVTADVAGSDMNGKTLTFTNTGNVGVVKAANGNITVNLAAGKSYTASEINKMLREADAGMTVSFDGEKTDAALHTISVVGGGLANGAGLASGGGLILQVGDTGDSFNMVSVSVDDMRSASLGIKGLDVSTAEAARASIKTIKSAINMVSTNRANMGALQNRLEYTINNLDVAAENMTAANSRIRDTDMAKQMMEYTKTNVLTQAAQAMLAQANQQPQSILQLLQ